MQSGERRCEANVSAGAELRVTGRSGNAPGQGPFMYMSLRIMEGVIRETAYETTQCPGSHACGKAMCELVLGKSVGEARSIRHQDLVSRVGPLPAHRRIGYGLALLALADALGQVSGESESHVE